MCIACNHDDNNKELLASVSANLFPSIITMCLFALLVSCLRCFLYLQNGLPLGTDVTSTCSYDLHLE